MYIVHCTLEMHRQVTTTDIIMFRRFDDRMNKNSVMFFCFKASDSIPYHGLWCGSYRVCGKRLRRNYMKGKLKGPQCHKTNAPFLSGDQRLAEPTLEHP